jgi:uncharacterized protein YjbI with pentapeptide repeats
MPLLLALVLATNTPAPTRAADMTAREVTALLFHASAAAPVSIEGRDLTGLDLSGLDFKSARLARTKFFRADLTGANLAHADLAGAQLDRATLVGTDFSGADLTGALIRLPHAVGSPNFDAASAPRFHNANLSRARLVARLDGADFRGANLAHANLGPYGDFTQNTLARRSVLVACNFANADLRGADFSEAILRFANFRNATLSNANLAHADISQADFTGADLTGANIADANFEGARLAGARGLDHAKGIETARNLERPIR